MTTTTRALGLCAAVMITLGTNAAHAYSYESMISDGCHEGLAKDTLRAARANQPQTCGPTATTPDDAAMIAEAPFSLESDLRDIEGFTFLVGIRDNDMKGRAPTDSTTLATVHGNPDGQPEHCLRRHENDEPNGTKEVIDECRADIEELIDHAIDEGVDEATGLPDTNARTRIAVYLAYSGHVDALLPIFYLYMGQALHAVEDSFSHMYRVGPRFEQITVAANWIDMVDGDYDERRDGPPHISAMDQCRGLDAYRTARLDAARQASIDVFEAASDRTATKADRKAHVHRVLDSWFVYKPGCTFETRWCDARENDYRPVDGGCNMGGTTGASGIAALIACALALRIARRARRLAAPLAFVALIALPHPAHAQNAEAPLKPPPQKESPWALSLSSSASIDHPGFVIGAGFRYRFGDGWIVGGDAEWNPWVSLESKTFQSGTLDVYGTLIKRFRITDSIRLRTSAHLGASVLLFPMYGAPAGTFGPYAGLSLVGLEVKTGQHTRFIFDPADVALPIPHITGAPLSYREYRMTIGFEFGG